MSDCFKCSMISLGIGMVAGVYIATNNKKIQKFVKDTQAMIEEKLDSSKQGASKSKEEYSPEEGSFEEEQLDMESYPKSSRKINKSKK